MNENLTSYIIANQISIEVLKQLLMEKGSINESEFKQRFDEEVKKRVDEIQKFKAQQGEQSQGEQSQGEQSQGGPAQGGPETQSS